MSQEYYSVEKETNLGRNIAKFIAGSWLFILVGLIMPFSIDKNKGKRFTKRAGTSHFNEKI